jgi:uncharacterized protein
MIFFTALLLGVFSSLHCVGMCGPIALALPLVRTNTFTVILSFVAYHLGRIVSYTLLGIIAGIIGIGFYNSIDQRWIFIACGVLIVLWVLVPLTNPENWRIMRNNLLIGGIRKKMGSLFRKRSIGSTFTIGILNGFIPCGMVYIALMSAVATGKWSSGGMFMLFYGLGTIPLMLILNFSWEMVKPVFRKKLVRLSPVFVGIIGVLLVLRGLELGIPFISPSVLPEASGMTMCQATGN